MVLSKLDLVVVDAFAELLCRCTIPELIQMLQAAHGDGEDLPRRLQHAGVLILQSLQVVGVASLSLIYLASVFKQLIHAWHIVAAFGVGIGRRLQEN